MFHYSHFWTQTRGGPVLLRRCSKRSYNRAFTEFNFFILNFFFFLNKQTKKTAEMSKTSRRWFIHLRGTQCFCQMISWSPERSSQTTRPSVFLRLTGLKVIIPPRVVIRRRLVCVFREIVKVAGIGGRGDLDQRTRLSPEGWRPSAGVGGGDPKRNLRQAWWAESEFLSSDPPS